MNKDFPSIDVAAAEADLERLVSELKSGKAKGFIVTRNGVPAALLVPMDY